MARTRDESSELEKDLPFSSAPGQILIGLVVSGLGAAWLVNQLNQSPRRSVHWAILMIAGGGAMTAIGVRGLLRQFAIATEARRALDEHPELEAGLR
ncbi:MAG: hypothetical protein NXI31_02700 [bacterium]|nr:hypothetical protein [bacterium]